MGLPDSWTARSDACKFCGGKLRPAATACAILWCIRCRLFFPLRKAEPNGR